MALIHFAERQTHRLIASRYPTVGVFDDLVDAADAEAAMRLESLTNDRMTGALGRLAAIPAADRAQGEQGASLAMAAFLHPSPGGGRFNRETLGAWYAACDPATAIAETLYHHTRRLRASAGGFPNTIQMRELISTPTAELHDIRGLQGERPELYDPDPAHYSASQAFGEGLRTAGADGILFASVRHSGGENVVLYKPRLAVPVIQGHHYDYCWDAAGEAVVLRLTAVA